MSRAMERLISYVLKRRGLIAVIYVVLALFGFYSWTRLSIDAYPDIADVTVQVVTQVPGLAAEEVEQQITVPLERALNGIPSLDMMRSKNAFGLSIIILVFLSCLDHRGKTGRAHAGYCRRGPSIWGRA